MESEQTNCPTSPKTRPVLTVVLIASLVTLAIVGCWRFLERRIDAQERQAAESVVLANQAWLTARFNRLARKDTETKALLFDRLNDLISRQEASEKRGGQPPFAVEDFLPSIVELFCLDNNDQGVYYTASGTVIDEVGFILTNKHALISADGSLIRFCGVGFTIDQRQPPKPEYVATALAVHNRDDLAVLRIIERLDGQPLPSSFIPLAVAGQTEAATSLKLGDVIYIGGYPGIGAETFTFTEGVVSGRVGTGLIKTSALIDSGTSGGAAFDAEGHFIGVPTAAIRGNIGGSLGYLIGADVIDRFLQDFYTHDLPIIEFGESTE